MHTNLYLPGLFEKGALKKMRQWLMACSPLHFSSTKIASINSSLFLKGKYIGNMEERGNRRRYGLGKTWNKEENDKSERRKSRSSESR